MPPNAWGPWPHVQLSLSRSPQGKQRNGLPKATSGTETLFTSPSLLLLSHLPAAPQRRGDCPHDQSEGEESRGAKTKAPFPTRATQTSTASGAEGNSTHRGSSQPDSACSSYPSTLLMPSRPQAPCVGSRGGLLLLPCQGLGCLWNSHTLTTDCRPGTPLVCYLFCRGRQAVGSSIDLLTPFPHDNGLWSLMLTDNNLWNTIQISS